MIDIRCKKCNRLLMKAHMVNGEIKCGKCGYINTIKMYFGKRHENSESGIVTTGS